MKSLMIVLAVALLCASEERCYTKQCANCQNGYQAEGRLDYPYVPPAQFYYVCHCSNIYYLKNGYCHKCSKYFGLFCHICTSGRCQQCYPGYGMNTTTIAANFYNPCKPCREMSPYCQYCINNTCTQCLQTFLLQNGSCVCPSYRNFDGYRCRMKQCYELFQNCISCTQFECTVCKDTFAVINGSCQCPPGTVNQMLKLQSTSLSQDICNSCSLYYGQCLVCDLNTCLLCKNNFVLTNNLCVCPEYRTLQNGTCKAKSCPDLFPNCINCTQFQCTQCMPNFVLSNKSCHSCQSIHNYCESCNKTTCFSCKPTFILVNNQCSCGPNMVMSNANGASASSAFCRNKQCHELFAKCLTCSQSQCYTCFNTFILDGDCKCPVGFAQNNQQCQDCSSLFPYCKNCTKQLCSSCKENFLLINNTCLCSSPDRFLNSNTCQLCNQTIGCINCLSITQCLLCHSNFTETAGKCLCKSGYFLKQAKCLRCQQFYGTGCLQCKLGLNCTKCSPGLELNQENKCIGCWSIHPFCTTCDPINLICHSCSHNYTLTADRKNCNCVLPTNFIASNGYCSKCSTKFEKCLECTSTQCVVCMNNLIVINGICGCPYGKYQKQGLCHNCNSTFPNCIQCNSTECLSCLTNFTLINTSCSCVSPRSYNSITNQCLSCRSQNCFLQVYRQYIQIGNFIYFKLNFNQKSSEIVYHNSLYFNLKAESNGKNLKIQQKGQIFMIDLQGLQKNQKNQITLSIPNKNYVTWQDLNLSNDPLPISYNLLTIKLDNNQQIYMKIFEQLNKYSHIMLVLSFSSFNRFMQETNIIQMVFLGNHSKDNNFGKLVHLSILQKHYKFINNQIVENPPGLNNPNIETNNMNYHIYGFKNSIISMFEQIFITLVAGILIFTYIRGYLKTKRYQKQFAFKNIVQYGPQYVFEGSFSLFSYIVIPLFAHLQIFLQNKDVFDLNQYIDLAVTIFLLSVPVFMMIYKLRKYPPWLERYSVLYGPLKSQNTIACIFYIFNSMRPYIIGVSVIFIADQNMLSKYIILGTNLLAFSLLLLNLSNFTSGLMLVLKLIKSCLSLAVSFAFQWEYINQKILIDYISSYAFLSIIVIEVLETITGIILVILRNKKLIKDIQPLNSAQQNQKQSRQKVRQGKKQLLTTLKKAKEQLAMMLKQKRQRNRKR